MNWRRILFKNYGVKIALLLMAVFLWFFVISSREYTQVIEVPIRIIGLKTDKVLISDPPETADVRFQGKGTSLLLLSLYGDVRMEINISTINQFYDYPVQLELINWAPGINVDIMEILRPDTVCIRLDELLEKRIKIQPMLTVKPSEGFVITENVKLDPDSVTVRGAKSIVKDLKYISTQVKYIEKATSSVNTRLELIPPENSHLSLDPEEVRAFVVLEKIESRTYSAIPVNVISSSSNKPKFCEPSVIDVKVRGAQSVLNQVDRNDIIVSVSSEGSPTGAGVFFPVVILPEGLELVEIIPDSVRLDYEEVDT